MPYLDLDMADVRSPINSQDGTPLITISRPSALQSCGRPANPPDEVGATASGDPGTSTGG